jgi:SAM-dependent methyltransferase
MSTRDRDGPVRHPVFARCYARLSRRMEDESDVAEHRQELLAGLRGRVVEVGAGNGLNFRHYPATVTEVVAVEPEAYLRRLAQAEAARAAVPVQVVNGTAEALPAGNGAFDAAVASLVLCSVRDQRRALAELWRVLRPGGQLRFYEHVRAQEPGFARVQRLVDGVWPLLAGGCHTSRDTVAAIAAAGFQVDRCRRFWFPEARVPSPSAPHALGVAHRPEAVSSG